MHYTRRTHPSLPLGKLNKWDSKPWVCPRQVHFSNVRLVLPLELQCTKSWEKHGKFVMKTHASINELPKFLLWLEIMFRASSDHYLYIIHHDKMDQQKTSIRPLQPIPNSWGHAIQLLVSLIGTITHSHGQKAYGHFANFFGWEIPSSQWDP